MDPAPSSSPILGLFRRSDVRWRIAPWVLLAVAGAVRLPQIGSVGIRYDDGAAYAADAMLWHRCMRFLGDSEARAALLTGDDAALEASKNRHRIDWQARYPKPCQGFTFLLAVMMFPLGEHPDVVLIVNAMLSMLTVLMLYRLVLLWGDRPTALLAAMLLAVAPYHVVYARTAFVESTAGFFVLVGVWLWARARMAKRRVGRGYFLSGLALGYACTCHYRSGYIVAAILLYELVALTALWGGAREGQTPIVSRLRCAAWMAVGGVAPALAIEAVFRIARYSALLLGHELPLATFWEGWWYWLDMVSSGVQAEGGASMQWSAFGVYGAYAYHWQGAVFLALAGLGACHGLRRAGPARIACVMVLVAIVMHVTQPFLVARGPSAVIPFVCLLAGAGCTAVWRWGGRRPRVVRSCVVGLFMMAAISGAMRSIEMLAPQSDVPAAARFISERGGMVAAPTMAKYALYIDDASIETIGLSNFCKHDQPCEALERLQEMGVRWIITDPQFWSFPEQGRHFIWYHEFFRQVAEIGEPAAWFPHITDYRWAFLVEGGGVDRLEAMRLAGAGPIQIYLIPSLASRSTLAATARETTSMTR